jgi:hypothetical protein
MDLRGVCVVARKTARTDMVVHKVLHFTLVYGVWWYIWMMQNLPPGQADGQTRKKPSMYYLLFP